MNELDHADVHRTVPLCCAADLVVGSKVLSADHTERSVDRRISSVDRKVLFVEGKVLVDRKVLTVDHTEQSVDRIMPSVGKVFVELVWNCR